MDKVAMYSKIYAPTHGPTMGDDRFYRVNYLPHLKGLSKQAAILEIGPGSGSFCAFLKRQGYLNYWCVELSKTHCGMLHSLGVSRTRIFNRDFMSLVLDRNFDLIVMSHVLEHFPKEQGILVVKKINRLLTPGGRALIEVPNMLDLIHGQVHALNAFDHYAFYTPDSLATLMDLAGVKEFEMYAVAPPFSGVVKRSLSYTKRRYNEFMNGFTSVSRNIGTFSFLCVIRKAGVPVKG